MNAGWLVTRPPGSQPTRQRFWGTVCQDGETAYVVLFLNDRCLLLPLAMTPGTTRPPQHATQCVLHPR
jgi:hypothetical protein